jgi:hypothetical protein
LGRHGPELLDRHTHLELAHQYRRLRVRYEKLADIPRAFITLGCALVCAKRLDSGFR